MVPLAREDKDYDGAPVKSQESAGGGPVDTELAMMPEVMQEGQNRLHGELYTRNWAFIAPPQQQRIAELTLCTVGTGLGSVIALLAARTGFQRFILADGDAVEESNLNRQAFLRSAIGANKADATSEMIRQIVPDATIEVIPRYVSGEDFAPLVDRADIIVNTIDLTSSASLQLNRVAHQRGKPVLFPLNVGWGGALLVFTPDSIALDDFLGFADKADKAVDEHSITTRLIERVLAGIPGGVPSYLQSMLPRFLSRDADSWPYDPQLGVTTHLTAALTIRAAVALATGEQVHTAPRVIWSDAAAEVTRPPAQGKKHRRGGIMGQFRRKGGKR